MLHPDYALNNEMLFSFKNKYHYTYPKTYIALNFSYAKITCNTHKNKKLWSIPLKLVPSLAKLPLPYLPPFHWEERLLIPKLVIPDSTHI